MTQRNTFLFGTVLAVAGAAVMADHYRSDTSNKQRPVAAQSAPVKAVATPIIDNAISQDDGIIELAPCSASMSGMMLAPAPKPKPVPAPVPAADHVAQQESEIIEFAPCSAGF